jgi:glucose/arabinose dehydrogenase
MKKLLIILLLHTLFSACSHAPINKVTNNYIMNYKDSLWMDSEDYVRYVDFFTRKPSSTGSTYKITGDCDGYQKIDVKTAPGFCVGLVYTGVGLRKPRSSAAIDSQQIVVTDMGSWSAFDGKIFLVNFQNGTSTLNEILSSKSFQNNDIRREIINRPHQITLHTDGKYYVGASTAILRFDPLAKNIVDSIEVLIQGLPAEGLHPLKSFAFDDKGSIFVNVGAATNVCHKNGIFGGLRKKSCEEAENKEIGQGQIRKYSIDNLGKVSTSFEVYALGLRNSVALVWDPIRQVLIQGENSRDAINKIASDLNNAEFPHDEINIVEKKHYGWPYCYDNNVNSPEWKNIDCSKYQIPHLFLPAHSAPLAFTIYSGALFPEWYQGRLLASFHGYESKGHRLVAFKRNDKGLPTGVPQSIIYDWDTRGEQKNGSPVGITELPDGSVIIIEDMNQKILRLFYDPAKGDGKPVQEIDGAVIDNSEERARDEETRRLKLIKKIAAGNVPPFTMFQSKVIDKSCFVCHGGENAPGIQLLKYDDEGNEARIIKSKKTKEFFSMVSGVAGFPQMPPQGFDNPEEKKEASRLLKLWLEQIE